MLRLLRKLRLLLTFPFKRFQETLPDLAQFGREAEDVSYGKPATT